MPITAIVLLAIGALSAIWPGPKFNHRPPASGGVFAPRIEYGNNHILIDVVKDTLPEDERDS